MDGISCNLNLLSPGVTRSKNSNTFDAVQINPTATSFNVNGQRGDYNLYLLDGATIKEYQHGSNTFSPSVDATVLTLDRTRPEGDVTAYVEHYHRERNHQGKCSAFSRG